MQSSISDALRSSEEKLRTEVAIIRKRCDVYRKRLQRALAKIKENEKFKNEMKRTSNLVEKGRYTPKVRALVRELVSYGCPMTKIGKVIHTFMRLFFSPVQSSRAKSRGPMHERTVSQIVEEGSVAADIQLGYEISVSPACTTGSDGTTHRNQNFEALHINLKAPQSYGDETSSALEQKVRLVGVRMSANHRAETQKNGDLTAIKEVLTVYRDSPLAENGDIPKERLNENFIALKLVGTHGDHAEDQKAKHRQLGEWKKERVGLALGERTFYDLPEEERKDILAKALKEKIEELGGEKVWEALAEKKKEEHKIECKNAILYELGGETYLNLPEEDGITCNLWVRAGCGMHKDLNASKGGSTGLKKMWEMMRFGPVQLMNKENDAAHQLADGDAEDPAANRAVEVSTGGAAKLVSLMGALLNHKDDKKGQHDTFRSYVLQKENRIFTFPDTSNTRYSSNLEAAAEVISRLDFYVDYMHFIRDSKEKPGLNHLESNILKGLHDLPTRTELAVFALYLESVSYPYIRELRKSGLEDMNAMECGPLLAKLKSHVKKLINLPGLILNSDSNPLEAIFLADEAKQQQYDIEIWKRPDAMKAVWVMAEHLPHLRDAFVAFLEASLTTWERFSEEYGENGEISRLTKEEKAKAWMPATNDANEGALGAYRISARNHPSMNTETFNAKAKYSRNDTEDFIEAKLAGDEEQAYLRQVARDRLLGKRDKKRRVDISEQHEAEVTAKRQRIQERKDEQSRRSEYLEELTLELDEDRVRQLKVPQLKEQLDKLRRFDRDIPKEKDIGRKDERLKVLLDALGRYKNRNV
ncbi:uncharacterized protein FOMMEDRAFT_74025 [Fomitiporia mediterranea MF3/22]|uniref:uncharacterized protein n=1 Tax=Fomitiporia mediterranea (strain MF3/22) TaxID=694068 RepID=UPI0004408E4B|nr:uncharacterized protein FOMMEDRAFT_74025 [Fomitiporia mediterranea MF3/22]EJD07885.1 hypothetical protein FOMMEDRAFT_74025 [Fomitiporia mediterranea MF3/22]